MSDLLIAARCVAPVILTCAALFAIACWWVKEMDDATRRMNARTAEVDEALTDWDAWECELRDRGAEL